MKPIMPQYEKLVQEMCRKPGRQYKHVVGVGCLVVGVFHSGIWILWEMC
jgi:hypothetical protein